MNEVTAGDYDYIEQLRQTAKTLTAQLGKEVQFENFNGVYFLKVTTGTGLLFKRKEMLFSLTIGNDLSVYCPEDLPLARRFGRLLEEKGYNVIIRRYFPSSKSDKTTEEK